MAAQGMLDGKVALVSGLGPNLGRSVALGLAAEGAEVVLAARREQRLRAVAEEISAAGGRASWRTCDVTDAEACAALAAGVGEDHGRLDVLVNNAFDDGDFTLFADADLDRWRRTMDVNLWGTLTLTKVLLPQLRAAGDARVIMINTMSVDRIEPRFGAYTASKGALAAVTKTLARELGPDGIRVNGIHPGYIYGDAVEWYLNHLAEQRGVDFQEVYDELAGETCLRYLPPADEVAGAVVLFASPLARAVTGQSLGVNAGHVLS